MTKFVYKATAENWRNSPLTVKGEGVPNNCTFSIKGDDTQYSIQGENVYKLNSLYLPALIGFIECSNGVYTYTHVSGLSRDSEYSCVAVAHVVSML